MKPDANQLFGNLFDDVHITDARLLNFGNNTLSVLTAANNGGEYDSYIALLNKSLPALQTEVSDVDTSLTQQLGKTLTNNQVLAIFKKTMSDKEGFIAEVLGGKGTAPYLEIYPKGINEYTVANKTTMPTLTNRVNAAAAKYATQLGTTITALLTGFQDSWKKSRDDQQQQIGTVGDNRTERTTARTGAETALLQTVHGIAGMYAPDMAKCLSFFNFSLLFTQSKHKHIKLSGTVAPGKTAVLLNHTLKEGNTVTAHNTDTNAPWCIFLSATADGTAPANAITLQPGEKRDIHPSELGDLHNTFLLIISLSDVNDGSYDVEIAGLEEADEK